LTNTQFFASENIADKICVLHIKDTGTLLPDTRMIHPFIQVHIIDVNTCKYLAKSNSFEAAISFNESASIYKKIDKTYTEIECNFIPPFATKYCDLRLRGETRAIYYEEIYINEEAIRIFDKNVIFLFELVDFNIKSIRENDSTLDNNFIKIAWAFLRPNGITGRHLGNIRLQLYNYKFDNNSNIRFSKELFCPNVLADFAWPYWEEYPSFLNIELRIVEKIVARKCQVEFLIPFVKEVSDKTYEKMLEECGEIMDKRVAKKEEEVSIDWKYRQKLLSWERGFNQECMIPTSKIYKLNTEEQGCMVLRFSNNGKFLAYTSTNYKGRSLIRIFDLEKGENFLDIGSHEGVIHDLKWYKSDDIIITSSSDCNLKIWSFKYDSPGFAKENDYKENESNCLLNSIMHPSFVYSIEFIYNPLANSDSVFVATACYDGCIRIWEIPKVPYSNLS